jgi:hypothetical protein
MGPAGRIGNGQGPAQARKSSRRERLCEPAVNVETIATEGGA